MSINLQHYQTRIRNWQRDVAGQPVDKDTIDPTFVANQNGYVKSEWFDEFVPHWKDYDQTIGHTTEQYVLLADDIADTAFTLIGLANAMHVELPTEIPNVSQAVANPIEIIQDIGWRISSMDSQTKTELCETIVYTLSLLDQLSKMLWIDLEAALEAVCDSNDTKLWTDTEVACMANQDQFTLFIVCSGPRRWRVNRKSDQKLIKSPSFTPPDLSKAIL